MRKLLVIRQVTTEIPECDPDESTACDGQHDCAYKKKPEDLNHVAAVCDHLYAKVRQTTVIP
jgi:hypothetical protein